MTATAVEQPASLPEQEHADIPEPEGTYWVWAVTHPVQWARRKFLVAAYPMSAFPLAVLFFIFFADEFDTAAFSTLAPEIEKTFNLTDRQFTSVVAVNLAVVFLLAIP